MEAAVLHSSGANDIQNLFKQIAALNAAKNKDALHLIEKAYSLAVKSADIVLIAEALYSKAMFHCEVSCNYEGSITLIDRALEDGKDNLPLALLIKLNVAKGINYYHKGNLDTALKFYVRGIELAEKREQTSEPHPVGLATLYYNVSTIFSGNKMYALRKEYLFKALVIAREQRNTFLEGRVLNALGGVLLEEQRFDEALEHLHVARHITETSNDKVGYATVVNNIGLAYTESGRHGEAIEYLLKSLTLKQEVGNKDTIAQSYIHLGLCYQKGDKHTEAVRFFKLAIELLAEIGAEKNLTDCYSFVAQSYAQLGDYAKAYSYQLQYDKLKDSLYSSIKASSISETISSFELSRNDRENNVLKTQSAYIKELAERLERGNHELKQFTNLVAHDFKEPLRMIRGYIQLIKRHLANKLSEDESELIAAAEAGIRQMDLLLYSLMELAKLNAKPVITQVDLNEILLQVKANLQETIAEHNVLIKAPTLPIINADFVQMVQLFQNLVGNAIKYNQSEQPIVEISVVQTSEAYRISIADNGIGIEPQYREQVFGLFQRLHSKAVYSGTGIGLAICKKIVDGLGGGIRVEDSGLGGSAFVVELPY